MIRALLFDMDGLIFDSERVVQRSWNIAGQELGYGNVGEHILNTLGMNVAGRSEYFAKTFGEYFPDEQFRDLARIKFFEIVEQEGLPVKPGMEELISYAKQMGYKAAVVTSSRREYAVEVLKNAGLYHYFDGFVFGDMVTRSKPDPEIYQKAYKMLGIRPEECIAFEDAPAGVESATSAGVDVIMVPDLVQPNEETKMRAWKVLETLDEAIEILRSEARSQ